MLFDRGVRRGLRLFSFVVSGATLAVLSAACGGSDNAEVGREAALIRGVWFCIANNSDTDLTITRAANTQGESFGLASLGRGQRQCYGTSGGSFPNDPKVTAWVKFPGDREVEVSGSNRIPGQPVVEVSGALIATLGEGETKGANLQYTVGAKSYSIPVAAGRATDDSDYKNLELIIQ